MRKSHREEIEKGRTTLAGTWEPGNPRNAVESVRGVKRWGGGKNKTMGVTAGHVASLINAEP